MELGFDFSGEKATEQVTNALNEYKAQPDVEVRKLLRKRFDIAFIDHSPELLKNIKETEEIFFVLLSDTATYRDTESEGALRNFLKIYLEGKPEETQIKDQTKFKIRLAKELKSNVLERVVRDIALTFVSKLEKQLATSADIFEISEGDLGTAEAIAANLTLSLGIIWDDALRVNMLTSSTATLLSERKNSADKEKLVDIFILLLQGASNHLLESACRFIVALVRHLETSQSDIAANLIGSLILKSDAREVLVRYLGENGIAKKQNESAVQLIEIKSDIERLRSKLRSKVYYSEAIEISKEIQGDLEKVKLEPEEKAELFKVLWETILYFDEFMAADDIDDSIAQNIKLIHELKAISGKLVDTQSRKFIAKEKEGNLASEMMLKMTRLQHRYLFNIFAMHYFNIPVSAEDGVIIQLEQYLARLPQSGNGDDFLAGDIFSAMIFLSGTQGNTLKGSLVINRDRITILSRTFHTLLNQREELATELITHTFSNLNRNTYFSIVFKSLMYEFVSKVIHDAPVHLRKKIALKLRDQLLIQQEYGFLFNDIVGALASSTKEEQKAILAELMRDFIKLSSRDMQLPYLLKRDSGIQALNEVAEGNDALKIQMMDMIRYFDRLTIIRYQIDQTIQQVSQAGSVVGEVGGRGLEVARRHPLKLTWWVFILLLYSWIGYANIVDEEDQHPLFLQFNAAVQEATQPIADFIIDLLPDRNPFLPAENNNQPPAEANVENPPAAETEVYVARPQSLTAQFTTFQRGDGTEIPLNVELRMPEGAVNESYQGGLLIAKGTAYNIIVDERNGIGDRAGEHMIIRDEGGKEYLVLFPDEISGRDTRAYIFEVSELSSTVNVRQLDQYVVYRYGNIYLRFANGHLIIMHRDAGADWQAGREITEFFAVGERLVVYTNDADDFVYFQDLLLRSNLQTFILRYVNNELDPFVLSSLEFVRGSIQSLIASHNSQESVRVTFEILNSLPIAPEGIQVVLAGHEAPRFITPEMIASIRSRQESGANISFIFRYYTGQSWSYDGASVANIFALYSSVQRSVLEIIDPNTGATERFILSANPADYGAAYESAFISDWVIIVHKKDNEGDFSGGNVLRTDVAWGVNADSSLTLTAGASTLTLINSSSPENPFGQVILPE